MISFAVKLKSGQQFIGIGLSTSDLMSLKIGEHVVLDLASIGVGLWTKGEDGERTFLQPRDSNILVMAGDSKEDVSELLNVKLPK